MFNLKKVPSGASIYKKGWMGPKPQLLPQAIYLKQQYNWKSWLSAEKNDHKMEKPKSVLDWLSFSIQWASWWQRQKSSLPLNIIGLSSCISKVPCNVTWTIRSNEAKQSVPWWNGALNYCGTSKQQLEMWKGYIRHFSWLMALVSNNGISQKNSAEVQDTTGEDFSQETNVTLLGILCVPLNSV